MKMRKIVAVMMAVLMLCCVIPFTATAEDATATIDFGDKANRVSYSTEQQVWAQNGITVTNDKAASTSNVGDYGGDGYPARFYKSSSLTVEYTGMTKIEFYCDDYKASYVTDLQASITTGSVAVDGTVVTVTFDAPVDSLFIETLVAQVRVDSIAVYGAAEPEVPAEPVVNEADFDTIVTTNANGDSSYNKTFTTESGWVTENSAIQTGGASVMNPQFPVIGEDNSSKAVCMNGKVSAPGKISSPTLTGGINKLTINYTKMFTDTKLSATVTITDLTTGAVYTHTIAKEAEANDKYTVWNDEWVLETPIAGDFTIVIANDCPSQATSNKDRMTILDIIWESNGGGSVTPPVEPDEPDVPVNPEDGTELSIADAIALGASMEHNVYTESKYYVTGVITEVYNDMYGNMRLTDDAGNILTVYGTYSADGSTRYDALEVKPVAGDTVKIYGIIGQYNGTPQIKNGWIVEHIAGETPDTPDVPDEPSSDLILIDTPVAGVAYKFGMIQGNVSATDVYYLIGGMSSFYMSTGTDAAAAIDVYLEETTGGYYMYAMVDGAKTYINMVVNGTHVNGAYEAAASTVYTYDAEAKTVIANVNDAPYWFGTRNDMTYTTVGPCKVEYAGFYCQFYASATTPDEPDQPDVPSDPAADSELTIPQAIELGLSKELNTYTEGKYYVTGKIVAISSAIYGNMYIVDENNNQLMIYGTYSADGEIRYDALEYMPVVGDTVTVYGVIGTYNGTEAQMKNGWITEIVKGDGEPENTDPAADSTLTVKEAIDLGLSKLHNVFTENKYYVTAEITEIYNDMYGNMRVTDADGNILTIYGTYDADGTNRFDAMETQPQVGDTVKFYGVIGQYNGTPQMKNAWIIAINPTDEPIDPDEPSDPVDPEDPEDPVDPTDPDEPGSDSPETGDNGPLYVALAVVLMALAAAAVVFTSKKRA